jgi:hypothetical protein
VNAPLRRPESEADSISRAACTCSLVAVHCIDMYLNALLFTASMPLPCYLPPFHVTSHWRHGGIKAGNAGKSNNRERKPTQQLPPPFRPLCFSDPASYRALVTHNVA